MTIVDIMCYDGEDDKKSSEKEGGVMPRQSKGKSKGTKKPRNRNGLLPGQYRRRAPVYNPRIRRADEEARYTDDDLMTTDVYIVQTNYLDREFNCTVELRGEMMRLPGRVIAKIISQREAILKESRSDRGREAAEKRRSRVEAEVEDVMAESEREQDLQGL